MDEPSTGELERLIERNHRETSADILDLKSQLTGNVSTLLAQFDRYVLAAVYEADEHRRKAERDADRERVTKLDEVVEEERTKREAEQTANRRMYKSAILVAALSVVTMVVGSVIISLLVGSSR